MFPGGGWWWERVGSEKTVYRPRSKETKICYHPLKDADSYIPLQYFHHRLSLDIRHDDLQIFNILAEKFMMMWDMYILG